MASAFYLLSASFAKLLYPAPFVFLNIPNSGGIAFGRQFSRKVLYTFGSRANPIVFDAPFCPSVQRAIRRIFNGSVQLIGILQRIGRPRMVRWLIGVLLALLFGAAMSIAYAWLVVAPNLPPLDAITDYRPKIPLRVYTADKILIGEFGAEHRNFTPIRAIPDVMKNALLAIEDARFYEHGGVDFKGVLRAILADLRGGGLAQGASTITMQVARNFFLTREKTGARKLSEIMLAYKIEAALSKDQILELYMNQVYLGERAYGFASAADVYFGKSLKELTIAQAAMLAGLPQAPAAYNPVANPERARQRQLLVLARMRALGYIDSAQYQQARIEPLQVRTDPHAFQTHAEYAAELVRQTMFAKYKEETYTRGFKVYTTIVKQDQDAAYQAVRRGVMEYDQRHGYRGPEARIELPADPDARQDAIDDALLKHPGSGDLQSAIVISASPKLVRAAMLSGETVEITGSGLRFAAAGLSAHAKPQFKVQPGAVIRVTQDAKKRWAIAQIPDVEAALIALNPQNGAVRAMVGGFDFNFSQFDHVTQAWRQPGSSFKPFIYSAALEKGFSPATIINDAPLSLDLADGGAAGWEPHNDDGSYDGPVSMRYALARSKNVVSVRILQAITPQYALAYLPRFGFDAARHPANLTLALGTGAVTPMQMAAAYAVFANGGYRVGSYLIQKVVDADGNVILETTPVSAGQTSARVLDPRNAFVMDSMMRDVVRSGTGALAGQRLPRSDLAGKTGTTSDAVDGWFAGYGGNLVAVAWMGYDDPKSLGGREFGATAALPIWIQYMREALKGKPESQLPVPPGLLQTDGDWMYQEFLNAGAIRSLGVEPEPEPEPAPAPAFPQKDLSYIN